MLSRQQVAGEHQLDRQQVLEQAQRRVGLADAQRRGGVVVLDAEVQRRVCPEWPARLVA